jgi:hypothetical protein
MSDLIVNTPITKIKPNISRALEKGEEKGTRLFCVWNSILPYRYTLLSAENITLTSSNKALSQ